MLQHTKGIVLRSVKYGESSIITTLFTEMYGVQSYVAKGIRGAKKNNAGLLQPTLLLSLECDYKPHKNLQYLKNFNLDYLYQSLQEDVVKNSVAIFCCEVLLRLLPPHAHMQEVFDYSFGFLKNLDKADQERTANFPLLFLIRISALLGYKIKGRYSAKNCFLNLEEGCFTSEAPVLFPLKNETIKALDDILSIEDEFFQRYKLPAAARAELTEWFLDFLRMHAQHLGAIKSLKILRTILH